MTPRYRLTFYRVVAPDGSGWQTGRTPEEAKENTTRDRLTTMREMYGRFRLYKRPNKHGAVSTWHDGDSVSSPESIRAEAFAEPVVRMAIEGETRVDIAFALAAALDCRIPYAQGLIRRLGGVQRAPASP